MKPTRKRMKNCPHCCQTITYSVYKKHKEEFYDVTNKQWTLAHHSTEEDSSVENPGCRRRSNQVRESIYSDILFGGS